MKRIDYSPGGIRLGSFRKNELNGYDKLGNLGKTEVLVLVRPKYIHVEGSLNDGNAYRHVFELVLRQVGEKVYTIDMIAFDNKYQGFSIATKLYKMVMKKLGIILEAGQSQSPGGRGLWCALSKVPGVEVFGSTNRKAKFLYEMVATDDGELTTECGINPYDKNSFRIYARVK